MEVPEVGTGEDVVDLLEGGEVLLVDGALFDRLRQVVKAADVILRPAGRVPRRGAVADDEGPVLALRQQ
jgi:hypothetical protein